MRISLAETTKWAAAALLCSSLTQHFFNRRSELWSETLSWMLLPMIYQVVGRWFKSDSGLKETLPTGSITGNNIPCANLWLIALSIGLISLHQAENGIIFFFVSFALQGMKRLVLIHSHILPQPATVPLLLLIQKGSYIKPTPAGYAWRSTGFWSRSVVAVFSIITLSKGNISRITLSSIPVLSGLFVFWIVLNSNSGNSVNTRCHIDIEHIIRPLSSRVVLVLLAILIGNVMMFGVSGVNAMHVIFLGLAKGLSGYFILQTVRHSTWSTAAAIVTVSIVSARDPFTFTSDTQVISHLISIFLNLGQVVYMVPASSNGRSALWVFIIIYIIPYILNIRAVYDAKSSVVCPHPIDKLIQDSKDNFNKFLQRQMTNYSAATQEYTRRYGVQPPPGLEAWYNYSISHHSYLVDDFDTIFRGVSPFWKMSGIEVVKAMDQVKGLPGNDLWYCQWTGQSGKIHCTHHHRRYDRGIRKFFETLLEDMRGILPDVTFLVNHLDEPRVLPPLLSPGKFPPSHIIDLSKQRSWEVLTRTCDSQKTKQSGKHSVERETLPFIDDHSSAIDLCSHFEYNGSHGITESPTSLPIIEGMVPILSTGSLSTMGDILFPSPAYMQAEFLYEDGNDKDWDDKKNNLYWAGSTTGGFARNDQWQALHRQRFVKLAQNIGENNYHYLRKDKRGMIKIARSSFLNRRLFHVAFTKIIQCDSKYCHDQKLYFETWPWADKDEALKSRFVFDIDGNGISGRYYKLLASKSTPLKHTLMQEWHSDRLWPWVHYIPVSQSMDELPELISYFTSESGQKQAQEIAEEGRAWFLKAFRKDDFTIYLYRLFLELARLQDPQRLGQ